MFIKKLYETIAKTLKKKKESTWSGGKANDGSQTLSLFSLKQDLTRDWSLRHHVYSSELHGRKDTVCTCIHDQ